MAKISVQDLEKGGRKISSNIDHFISLFFSFNSISKLFAGVLGVAQKDVRVVFE